MNDNDLFSTNLLDELSGTFNPDDIHWRVGSTNKKAYERNNGKWADGNAMKREGMPLAYIDARNVMQRLDDVMGAANWQDSYQDSPKRLFCKIELRLDGEWVGKTDGAGDTDVEGQKGGISDAFKRAAVKWGVGRYLYECKTPWMELTERWALKKDFDGSIYLPGFSSKMAKTKSWNALKDAAAEDDALKCGETWRELTSDQQKELWKELSSGQRSTIKKLLAETGDDDE